MTVTVVHFLPILFTSQWNAPARLALHKLDVLEKLTTTDSSNSIVIQQCLFTLLQQVIDVISVTEISEALVESLVTNVRVLVCRHRCYWY